MNEINLFYYKLLSELQKKKAKRSFNERTLFDFKGKRMRRKLEKGFVNGVNCSIDILKKVKKEFDVQYAEAEFEHKERTFDKQVY